MKGRSFLLLACSIAFSIFLIHSCSSLPSGEPDPEAEFAPQALVTPGAVEEPSGDPGTQPIKYCVYEVWDVRGSNCKFSIGDKICFQCDNNDECPNYPDHNVRNFGDGCHTYVRKSDSTCATRGASECDGRYR